MNESFIYNSVHRYRRAQRQTNKDVILYKIGVHVELIAKQRSPLPTLTDDERQAVIVWTNDFLRSQNFTHLIQ